VATVVNELNASNYQYQCTRILNTKGRHNLWTRCQWCQTSMLETPHQTNACQQIPILKNFTNHSYLTPSAYMICCANVNHLLIVAAHQW